ncbi:MAG: flagellar motor protein MotB [Proteobacteria bacterium]|nr:flagellar motor protein MotB [Pseudomonadota bacterium]
MAKTTKQDEVRPIIVKKIKKSGGGHHGGAWKVAYADFVTAMMAFFLLLWLLNVSTDDALETISNYFDPSHPKISTTTSGAGGIMGGVSVAQEGAMTTNVQPLAQQQPTGLPRQQNQQSQQSESNDVKKLEEHLRKQEEEGFKKAKAELEKAMQESEEMKELAKNLMVDITPEGLRIQLVDQEGKPMFPLGSAEMFDYTKKLVALVARVVNDMPNDISIRGHTDSHQYAVGARYTNWELSSDRSNSSRRELLKAGVKAERVANVMGRADREPLVPENPTDERNRRVSIILLNETLQHAHERGAFGKVSEEVEKEIEERSPLPETGYQKTPGAIYFP